MKRFVFILLPFFCAPLIGLAQLHSVNAAEYYFDSDPGPGHGIPISVTTDDVVALDGTISTSGLSPGVHVLNVRVRREDGIWSTTTRRMIRIGIGTTFSAAEVFFDTDPGLGAATAIPITAAGVMNQSAFPIPALTRGFHRLNLRCYSGGTWSAASSKVLRLGSALIDGAEAYFDTDPGEGHGIPIDVGTGLDVTALDSSVSVLAAGTGFHNVYMRFRGGGVWSFPKNQTLRIGPWVDGGADRISGAEFFVDSDPGPGNGCALYASDGAFDSGSEAAQRYIMGSALGQGSHVIGLRIRDGGGRWQNTIRDTVQVLQAHVVTTVRADTTGQHVLVAWNTYPSATLYRVHYDSTWAGAFSGFISVNPPDTSVLLNPDGMKRFFKVFAVQPDAQPCGSTLQEASLPDRRANLQHLTQQDKP
jgi:hypothetical protein